MGFSRYHNLANPLNHTFGSGDEVKSWVQYVLCLGKYWNCIKKEKSLGSESELAKALSIARCTVIYFLCYLCLGFVMCHVFFTGQPGVRQGRRNGMVGQILLLPTPIWLVTSMDLHRCDREWNLAPYVQVRMKTQTGFLCVRQGGQGTLLYRMKIVLEFCWMSAGNSKHKQFIFLETFPALRLSV